MAIRGPIKDFDQRVTFQAKSVDDDGQGGSENEVWSNITTIPTMWARVVTSDGSEGDEGEQKVQVVHRIVVTIRNRSDITELHKLVWRGTDYNIRSVTPYNKRDEYRQIVAESGPPL